MNRFNWFSARTRLGLICTIAGVFAIITLTGPARAAVVVYDSPAKNYITGIKHLAITGTSKDDTYNVTFVDDTFNGAYGAAATTGDLTFGAADAFTVSNQINAVLNGATPHDLVASATSATVATSLMLDAYMLPHYATTTYAATLNLIWSWTGLWSYEGGGSNQARNSNLVPVICNGCTTKFAVFTVPEPASMGLFGLGLLGLGAARRRQNPAA
ncbi:MAG: PEP-CTERM sorting domain-containing protein [Alphaproteobacteria bacterium]|jgi:hypothetical protein|nr:PEP-CTERM sorting domain-containing protein [Alphaproteobacteria bacterium]